MTSEVFTRGGAGRWALPLLPGILVVWLAFRGGGFFAGTAASLSVGLLLLMVLRVTLLERPFEGVTRSLAVAATALGLLAIWALASSGRSDSAARAILQFDLILLYALGLLTFGASSWTTQRIRAMTWGIAAGIALVCAIALITRVLPDVWPTAPGLPSSRLSYPLTYTNALGLLGALGAIFCLHLTSSEREPPPVRIAAAAALPGLAATVFFTFSRGAIAAGIFGLVAYMVLARPRLLATGLVAAVPPTLVAVLVAYDAELLAQPNPTGPAAVLQGHRVAAIVALCVGWSALVRLGLMSADRRLAATRLTDAARARIRATVAAAAAAGLLILVVLDAHSYIERQYDRFVTPPEPTAQSTDLRTRLTDPGNNGRIDYWRVAWDRFGERPLEGNGAGVFRLQWERDRQVPYSATNAHSLYLETLDELGLIGLALLLVALGAILAGFAVRIRGPDRALYALLLSAGLLWALAAGIDWHWNLPAVTFWLFAVGGAALARRATTSEEVTTETTPDEATTETASDDPTGAATGAPERASAFVEPGRMARVLVGIGCLIVAVTPARVALSQRSLNDSVNSLRAGDCGSAIDHALGSASALSQRPEPFEVLGYCDLRIGKPDLAVRVMESAVNRDPRNWEFHYGLAVARGAAGMDPRPEARTALRLNPMNTLLQETATRFDAAPPKDWVGLALAAPQIPGFAEVQGR